MVRTSGTLLVLGAGSSAGFGLPLGFGLRDIIADYLNVRYDEWGSRLISGSHEIVAAIQDIIRLSGSSEKNINDYRRAAVQISRSMPLSSSIDEYVERHSDDALKVCCAKLAIAKAILEAERNSSLYTSPVSDADPLDNVSQTWLAYFLRDVTRGVPKQKLHTVLSDVTIVNFNYDRCVEHFIYHWLQRVYDLTPEDAAALCSDVKIYHPYGYLGPLPYTNGGQGVPFGAKTDHQKIIRISKQIRTYSEAVDDISQPSFYRDALIDAKKIVFLGFGFHTQNIQVLGAAGIKRTTLRCYATTNGIPAPRVDIIKSQIAQSMQVEAPGGLFFNEMAGTCEEFWTQYGDALLR